MQLAITEAIDLLSTHEVESVSLRRGTASVVLRLTPGGDFKVVIQQPGQREKRLKMDEYELLGWWMEWEG